MKGLTPESRRTFPKGSLLLPFLSLCGILKRGGFLPIRKVLLAYNSAVLSQEEEERYAAQQELKGQTLHLIQEALEEGGYEVCLLDVERPLEEVVRFLSKQSVHFVFNLTTCVSSVYSQALFPLLLDALRIPYLGSQAVVHALCLDRFLTKVFLRGLGIPTPSFVLWEEGGPWPETFEFPLFVKPRFREHLGKRIRSVLVNDAENMEREALRIFRETEEKVLLEKYIPGRELVVGLWGNGREFSVLPIVETRSSERFREEILKDVDLGEDLTSQIQRMAIKIFQELNMQDYATFRLILSEKEAMPFFFEINALPSLYFRQSPFPEMCAAADIDYTGMIQRLFHIAAQRVRNNG